MDEQLMETMRDSMMWPLAKIVFITLGGLSLVKILLMFLMPGKKRGRRHSVNKGKAAFAAPICPRCGGAMVKRYRKTDGKPFYGCKDYPKCHGIVDVG